MQKSSISLVSNSSSIIRCASASFMAKLPCRVIQTQLLFGRISHNRYSECSLLKSSSSSYGFGVNGLSFGTPHMKLRSWSPPNSFPSFCTRYFSEVTKSNESSSGSGVIKFWKKKKPFYSWYNKTKCRAAAKSKDSSLVTTSTENQPNAVLSKDKLEPSDSTEKVPKVNGKEKKKTPRSKKKEEPETAVASAAEVAVVKTKVKKKKPASKKSSKSAANAQVTKKISTIEMPVEVVNGSASSPKPSSKKSEKSIKKVKTVVKQKLIPMYPPVGKSVVVVESVTKAKVIQGYLGNMYQVMPSYGHVRDLAARSGSVRPNEDFSMVWEVPSAAWTHLKSIKVALAGAENLILASDPDREGEAIAWHILEMLQQQDALRENHTVTRVVFHEITEASIKTALQTPRVIDENLVHAYLGRRALDYLIGFNISPLLWRKLPGCRSAGRVQSAALSLINDRETEIDEFKPQEYWTVNAKFNKEDPSSSKTFSFFAHLTHLESKKLNQLSIKSDLKAKEVDEKVNSETFQVVDSKRSTSRRNPPTPYITSTLQQDAANKLNFNTTYTMKLAQKLYEGVQLSDKAVGLITYMRTDGLHISNDAVEKIRSLVSERYGAEYVPESARKYFKKVKNAQEAHEAIRPTDIRRLPSMLVGILDEDPLKLYTLIWSRTAACQMTHATIDQIQVDVGNASQSLVFRSSLSRVNFRGYKAVYEDAESEAIRFKENDGNDREEAYRVLDSLKQGDLLSVGEVELKQHHTQALPRYSEGSLVKKLEELGIGRPSTYASTLKVLQDRNYVTIKSRVLYPEFRGRMVSAFLSHYFSEVADYSFTADMETELDNVSAGMTEWKGLLRDYWTRFSSHCKNAESIHIHQVEKMLEKTYGDFLFASIPNQSRTCPSCNEGTLIFKVSKVGAGYFIGCNRHPDCKYIAKTLYGEDDAEGEEDAPPRDSVVFEPKLLGLNPGSEEKIFVKRGPYGYYIQKGEDRAGYSPKRVSLTHQKDVDNVTLEDALELMKFPITLGKHPKDKKPVLLRLVKNGLGVRHGATMAAVPKNLTHKDVTLEKALKLLSGNNTSHCGRPKNKPKVEESEDAM